MTTQIMTINDFHPHKSTKFSIQCGDESVPHEMELIDIEELKNSRMEGQNKGFVLTFRSLSNGILPQKIYTLSHEILGEVQIFMVPIGPDEKGQRYEAVFN